MKRPDARLRLEGERRQVTVLFYDIVGSTEILVRGDPEQYFRSVTILHTIAEAIVGSHGGYLHKRLGDGGSCFFGYPEQSEDAAESAVYAALELIRTVTTRARKTEDAFSLRIGIATGLVVFSSESDEIVGTAPILASRLQAVAEPNSVLVADATFELTRSKFVYRRVGEVKLKGFVMPNTLWRPEAKPHAPSLPSRKVGHAMIGRDWELSGLVNAWNAARAGSGGAFAIVGEAGIGKSRLISEFRRSIDENGLALQCNKRFEGQPFHPFIGFLETVVDPGVLKCGGGPLRDAFRAAGMEVDTEVAETIGAFTSDRSRATARNIRVADLTGRAFRRHVIDAAVRLLCCSASAGPILIVFEDVHWADEMTLELLNNLCARALTLPILIIHTSRHSRVDEGATKLSLTGLPSAAMRELVTSIWDGPPPPGLSDFILEQCDGMPLYAEELAHFFRAKYASGQPVSEWKNLLMDGGVSSLNDLLSSRLAGAGAARRVAQFASVIGRVFTIGLIANLLEGADRDGLDTYLEDLAAHGIIEPSSNQAGTYQFRHVLLQDAAYSSLLKSDRRRIHKRIARLLVEKSVPPLPDAIAAWQCAEAGRHGDAVRFALMAAEACVLRSAMKEASLSLDLCTKEIASMSRQHPDRSELLLTMLQLQGVVATALEGEGSERARTIYSRAMQLVRRRPSATREDHFPAYWGWWFTAPNARTQRSRARILVEDMMAVNDTETRLQSYHCAWATSFHAGDHGFCLDCVERGLELYDPDRAVTNRTFFGGHDAKVCGLGESALSQLIIDKVDASENAINQSLEYAASIDHVGSLVHALYYALVLRRCQGRYEDVHVLGEKMLSLAGQHGLIASQARAHMYCGWAELMTSTTESGATRFQEGLALHQRSGTDDNLTIHSDMHSQVLQMIGKPREALSVLDSAISVGRKSGQWFWLAELYRQRARVRHEMGDRHARVKSDLARAVRIADTQGAAWLLRRAERDLIGLG
ncbi:ATP-binding protein [Rhizobium wenxiniae]|uniref:ATP-binding protein n=1 Tax=Rhizobium wenxiniae TaxID=1737357 RepID=UPI003C187542